MFSKELKKIIDIEVLLLFVKLGSNDQQYYF